MAKLLKRLRSGSKESLKSRLEELENKLRTQDEWYTRLEKKNKEFYEENIILKREKDELLKRLSKAAGDIMTKGNPSIADLSDQSRPTKLGEQWNALYTNEWTDAYEELRHDAQRNIPKTIEKQLLDIVVLCYKRCHEIAEDQMKKARTSMNGFEHYIMEDSTPDRNRNMVSPSFLPRTTRVGEMFIDEVISNYKERRKHDTDWIQSVRKKLVNLISQKGIQLPKVLEFTSKCAELCWFMCIQDPPLVIEYDNVEGNPVDRSKFNLYDRTGTITEYVIWPALLLHQNGPVIAKGAVQPLPSYKTPAVTMEPTSPTVQENKIKVMSKSVRGIGGPSNEHEARVHSSRLPDKNFSSLRMDRLSKSSGNAREKQGIIYYNEQANMLLNDRMSPKLQGQHPFSYNYAKEVTVHQSPRPRVSNFNDHVLIGRNKTSIVTKHAQKPDFAKSIHGPQKIFVANQTAV